MGLFGGTTIAVASTVYNMAGDIEKRMNYLKTTVVQNVLSNTKFDLTDTLSQSYMNGPGIKARNFCRWAIDHYQGIGIPEVNLGFADTINTTTIQGYIPVDTGQTATLIAVQWDSGDPVFWAEQWICLNKPSMIDDAFVVAPDTSGNLVITYSDTTTDTFTPVGYDPADLYFYVSYNLADGSGPLGKRVWIYKIGTGHADMDSMIHQSLTTDNTFFPIIPIRLDNNFLSSTYRPDVYDLAAKAYKKATNQKFDKLVDQLKDNTSIGDIDHIYMVYGCSLNTVENSSKKYIWDLFNQLYTSSSGAKSIEIKEQGTLLNTYYHIIMEWGSITQSTSSGQFNDSAKSGDVEFSLSGSNDLHMSRQINADTYMEMTVSNLIHYNNIYQDKSVETTVAQALADTDESGFIVPLSYEIQREMSIIDSTQMMTSAVYLVMNSYVVKKQKWYQTGIFKIIVFIAIIAISVATGGAGGIGLLGTNFAVGSALGLSGLAATIVGAVANALAAMILVTIIDKVAIAAFGPKLGQIIGAIVAVVAVAVGAGLMNGQSLSAIWGNLASAQNIIGMTSAVGNGVAGYIQAAAQGWGQKTTDLMNSYDKASKDIQEKFLKDFGGGSFGFDALSLTDIGQDLGNSAETVEQFLQRTLMTGTDIAQMSIDMLTNFSDLTLDTSTMFSS